MLKRIGDASEETSKRPRLEFSTKTNSWGEDSDDEILLIASQACENVEKSNSSSKNSFVFNPPTLHFNENTSRHVTDVSDNDIIFSSQSKPSTSANISYDTYSNSKPLSTPLDSTAHSSTFGDLKNNTISTNKNISESKKTIKNYDRFTQEYHRIKEVNRKLKEEQEKLVEQNFTKDGEISILRAQMQKFQKHITAIKSEKFKCHEMAQLEFSEKIKKANEDLDSFKSQIEFKNLEITNLKEKCRLLESSKIKFVEPIMSTMDNVKWPGASQKMNSSLRQDHTVKRFVSTKENSSQIYITNNVMLYPLQLTLYPLKDEINNHIFMKSAKENPIYFNSDKNFKFKEHSTFLFMREKILHDIIGSNEFNRNKIDNEYNMKVEYIYEDLTRLMNTSERQLNCSDSIKTAIKIVRISKEFLIQCLNRLEYLSSTISVKTMREMDEKYLESSKISTNLMTEKNFFDGNLWFHNEQGVEIRRLLGLLSVICKYMKPVANYILGIKNIEIVRLWNSTEDLKFLLQYEKNRQNNNQDLLEPFLDICKKINEIQCSHLYTGLLSSLCCVLKSCVNNCSCEEVVCKKLYEILKELLMLRPHVIVIKHICGFLNLIDNKTFLELLCTNSESGNIILDYSEGIATYSHSTCSIQLLCNNVEVWIGHFSNSEHMSLCFSITDNILKFVRHIDSAHLLWRKQDSQYNCKCSLRLNNCICSCLYQCAFLYKEHYQNIKDVSLLKKFGCILRTGIMLLNFCNIKDAQFSIRLGDYENHYQMFLVICETLSDQLELQDIHRELIIELKENPSIDTTSEPLACDIWKESFDNFLISD